MKFISFYTTNGRYPQLADVLRQSLRKHQLEHDIRQIEPFSDWYQSVLFKSKFILNNLLKHKADVVWLDIDTEIWRAPKLLSHDCDFAIYNWYADSNHHLEGRIKYSKSPKQLLCSGGVQKWAYTKPAIQLLKNWGALCQSNIDKSPKQEDDWLLDQAFNEYQGSLKTLWLPKTYNRMDKLSEHWSKIPIRDVFINHDYTRGGHRIA